MRLNSLSQECGGPRDKPLRIVRGTHHLEHTAFSFAEGQQGVLLKANMLPRGASHCHSDEWSRIGLQKRRWLTPSMVLRLAALTAMVIPPAVTLAVGGKSRHAETFGSGRPLRGRALLSVVRDLKLFGLSRAASTKDQTNKQGIDTEVTNITIVLEHVQLGPQEGSGSPWMFSLGEAPYAATSDPERAYFANSKFTWNPNGTGNSSCASGGTGELSRGYIDPYHNYLGLPTTPDYTHTAASLENLELSEFTHINTESLKESWNVLGKAGDSRRYRNGVFEIREDDNPLFRATEVQWIQNLSYPSPAGASKPGVFELSAYFVGKIDYLSSHNDWIARLDPLGIGYVLGIVTGGSFGAPSCYTSNSYWITLRGFPELNSAGHGAMGGGSGGNRELANAKQGTYPGSSDNAISMARALAAIARAAVTAVTVTAVGAALTGAAVAASGGAGPAPPGSGVAGLLKAAAFSAKVSQIQGFHTDAMKEFGSGLDPFLLRFQSPFGTSNSSSDAVVRELQGMNTMVRIATNATAGPHPPTTITEDLFKGTAFFSTLVVVGFLLVHMAIWLATRKKPLATQVGSHAWMIYLFSIAMSYIYTASVLNSIQYFRSNIPYGTGRFSIYFVAAAQLLLIGLGFTVFFFTIMTLALKRLRIQQVRWVPKELLADPVLRRSVKIAGEYEAENHVWFHQLFQCYYDAMSGPRVWLAALDLSIVFLDAAISALIWNAVVCLGILMSIYAVLFCIFVSLLPHRDKIQGGLVCLLVFVELLCYIFEFVGALGSYTTSEKCESIGVVLGFLVIALAVVIALYCDVIPILHELISGGMRWYRIRKYGFDSRDHENALEKKSSVSSSEWSALLSDSPGDVDDWRSVPEDDGAFSIDSEALVAYNAKRESVMEETMREVLARRR
jgi:hypothetical protein